MIDSNGTQHDYGMDGLGRQVSDTATVLGAGVDGAVRRIDTAFDFQGNVALTTSYSSTTDDPADIVNQVADTYNGFGMLTEEQQSVSGAVTSSTPAVLYSYANGTATPTRLTGITYPNGRVLTYGYDPGADIAVGRVSYLADSDGTQLVDYYYLGLGQIDDVSSPQPGIDLNLGQKGSNGQLDCVDQFNRATDMVFAENGGNIDEIRAGYDVSGNELWQANPTAAANGVGLDELFTYNALNELTSATRGTLNSTDTAITANQTLTENWTLDGMGNWSNYTKSGGPAPIDQDRDTNSLNEITDYNGTSTWAVPGYDAAGNMTTMPQPGNETTGLTCVYDAWDRLVEVGSGSTVLATYSYDGLNRRITETAGGPTTAYYYDTNDQVLEERVDGSSSADLQYVWGLRNVNDLVLRDSNNGTGGNLGISGSGLGLRLYSLQDSNWNVIALVSSSGAVQERFSYTAFGTATALNPNFSTYSGPTNFHWTTLFAGREVDTATGLYYNNARWYNPSLGVFVTTDPALADPNTYRYAGNNPVTATDPSGKMIFIPWVWDPGLNAFVDPQTGMTMQQTFAIARACAMAQMAAAGNGQSWLQQYSAWFNSNVPGGQAWSTSVGLGIYSLKQTGMSNTEIANESDTELATQAVAMSVIAVASVLLGGEALAGGVAAAEGEAAVGETVVELGEVAEGAEGLNPGAVDTLLGQDSPLPPGAQGWPGWGEGGTSPPFPNSGLN